MISEHSFAAIDFESAGAQRGKTDVPVQVGMSSWSPLNGHSNPFVSFIRADRPITWAASKVHGISTNDLADAPTLPLLWPKIKATLSGKIVVAHGHGTEKRYLRTFPGHGFGPWVDTLLLARAAWPELKSHKLGYLCDHFALTKKINDLVADKTWHDALYDATASLVLLEYIIKQFQLLETTSDILIYPDNTEWHRLRRQ